MNDLLLALTASATASALLGLHGLARRQTARWPWWARDLACQLPTAAIIFVLLRLLLCQ